MTSFKVHFMCHFHLAIRWEVIPVEHRAQGPTIPHFLTVSFPSAKISRPPNESGAAINRENRIRKGASR